VLLLNILFLVDELFTIKMRILITGGTGSLGTALQKRLAKDNELFIFSRDEQKHIALPSNVTSMIGDVRDLERLRLAVVGCDMVIHAAAMKHVDICEREPFECIETNIVGAKNVIKACIEQNVRKIVAISTDKAVNPINMYGASKLASDKAFLSANNYARGEQEFCVVRYGNVMGSKGSVIPKWVELAKQGKPLPITHPEMTRFMMKMDDAVDMVVNAKKGMNIAKAPSMRMMDVLTAVWCTFAPMPQREAPLYNDIGVRPGEKLHEQLDTDYYSNKNDDWMTLEHLQQWLEENYG